MQWIDDDLHNASENNNLCGTAQETDALSRILSANGAPAGRPDLARFKRALAHDRGGRAGFDRMASSANGAAADAVLDIEAERL